jgi:hypothetical protein
MVTIRTSERDRRVMVKCAAARWLVTGQLQRLCFGGVSADAVRKSLRRLVEHGYLIMHREHSMAEAIFGLGPKGRAALAAKGLTAEGVREPPRQLEHLIGINDIRIAAELSRHKVLYCFASWELQALGWTHPVIPDLVLGLQFAERTTILFEYDRGTEGVETLCRKFQWYEGGLSGVVFSAVLVVTDTAKRLEMVSRKMDIDDSRPVAGCVLSDLVQAGLEGRIFTDLPRAAGLFSLEELTQ